MLAGKVGNVAFLLQKFKEGLEFWNDAGGAPAPKSLDMTDEERSLAFFINKFDAAICASDCVEEAELPDHYNCTDVIDVEHPPGSNGSSTPPNNNTSPRLPDAPSKRSRTLHQRSRICTDTRDDILDVDPDIRSALCINCSSLQKVPDSTPAGESICISNDVEKVSITTFTQDCNPDQATLKHFIATEEHPLRIEYRCPACRNCAPCRDAVETEKISLREEAEDAEIRDSVRLDFKNRRFLCRLPLRGNVEEFLSSNQHSAQKSSTSNANCIVRMRQSGISLLMP